MRGMKANDSCRCHLTRTDGTEWLVTELHLGEGGPFVTARRLNGSAEGSLNGSAEGRRNGNHEARRNGNHGGRRNGPVGGSLNGHAAARRNGASTGSGRPRSEAESGEGIGEERANGSLLEEPLTAGDRLEWVSEDGAVRWAMRIPVGFAGEAETLRKTA